MSIKFPRYFKDAAQLLKKASEQDINVKNLLFNDKKYQHYNIKSLYAIITKALQNWDVIETLIKDSNIVVEHKLDIWKVRVVITELLFGKKIFPNPENHTLKIIIQYEDQFKEILSKKGIKALIERNAKDDSNVAKVRFVKVNLIKGNVKSIINSLQEEGWEYLATAPNYQDYLQQLRDLEPTSFVFLQDFHFPEVLAFPPGTELQNHELYLNGSVLFMDKASCLAPYLLAPEQNSHVLDMCAAPGLKTIQLASYVKSGKVYAVERDEQRFKTLQMMVGQSGADNVETILQDVTTLNVEQFKHVEYILVDPSCTGSGIRTRQPSAALKERLDKKTRLEKLSGFQFILLRFALTKFPAAKRVVYSTCSFNVEENEKVVEAALNSPNHNFNVMSVQDKLPGWQNFGSNAFQFGSKCIYSRPENDQTNGFFVAVFERRENFSEALISNNQISNAKIDNQCKGRKRRKTKEEYDENDYLNKAHKRLKEPNEKEKENKVVSPNSQPKSETIRVKGKVKKMSLSEKKRSRKRTLKIRKKLYPKSKKDKSANPKINNNGSTDLVEKPDNSKEKSIPISKSKRRYNRLKKLKQTLSSGSDNSNSKSLVKMSNRLSTQPRKGNSKHSKEEKKGDNPLQVSPCLESGNISLVKKKIKGEVSALNDQKEAKTNIFDKDTSGEQIEKNHENGGRPSERLSKYSTEFIEGNESRQPSKKKHKKNHSLDHQNTCTNNDSNNKDNGANLDNLYSSYQRITDKESMCCKNISVWLKKQKCKKKYLSIDNDQMLDILHQTKEEIAINNSGQENQIKKHKNKHLSDSNIQNEENFNKVNISSKRDQTEEEFHDKSKEGAHNKKRKTKHPSSDT